MLLRFVTAWERSAVSWLMTTFSVVDEAVKGSRDGDQTFPRQDSAQRHQQAPELLRDGDIVGRAVVTFGESAATPRNNTEKVA